MNTRYLQLRNAPRWRINIGFMVLILLWIFLILDILWPIISNLSNSPSNMKLPESGGINYLIIAPQALRKSTFAWADYRRRTGYQTQVILLTPDQSKSERIRDLVQETYKDSGEPYPFYVLLIGHAHPFSSHPDTYLPTDHFSIKPGHFSGYGSDPIATDDGYTSTNPDGIPDHTLPIFIGRIPVRTEKEALLLLERTRAYEETPPTGKGRARIELVASNAGFDPQLDPIFNLALKTLMQKMLPNEYRWHLLNGNPQSPHNYSVYTFPKEVARRFDSGALALVYIGHGQPDMICCAYSREGLPGEIFSIDDSGLLQNAEASLGIFTACSAGTYDLAGDDLSVVESIYLSPDGPVGTYSSSAWINGGLNGRLVIDLFEALLIDQAPTLGEWVGRIENWSQMIHSRALFTAVVKVVIPRFSGIYENKLLRSPAVSNQELDIQHATYNLFSDPALRIVYPKPGMEVSPDWSWQFWKGGLAFHGKSDLPPGQQVSISLETLPGDVISINNQIVGTINGNAQANNPVIGKIDAYVESDGDFSGRIIMPPHTPSGKYLLRAITVWEDGTYVAAHPVYIGGPPIETLLSSAVFWWFVISTIIVLASGLQLNRHGFCGKPGRPFKFLNAFI